MGALNQCRWCMGLEAKPMGPRYENQGKERVELAAPTQNAADLALPVRQRCPLEGVTRR